jgi:hypothetical protein
MSDDELLSFGQQLRDLVYPLTYGADGKPSVSAFSIQLDHARREWLRREQNIQKKMRPYQSGRFCRNA